MMLWLVVCAESPPPQVCCETASVEAIGNAEALVSEILGKHSQRPSLPERCEERLFLAFIQ